MALLGTAFVRVRPDTDGFEKEASSKLGGGLKKVAGLVTTAFASVKVGGFLKDAIGEASDYGETVSKSANVFGAKLAPAIQQFAATAPKAFGISETAALAATAQFGNMFKQLGFTGDAAAKASTNLIQTAADLGSFNNVDPSDVLERIGASLRGEFDSLQQLIPNINATRVANEALAATGKTSADSLTAQEKATATLAIIQKDGALAANDFAETSGGLANQQRILAATIDTLQRRLGEAFLPTATKVVTFLTANAEPAFNRAAVATKTFLDAFQGRAEVDGLDGSLRTVSGAGTKAQEVFKTARRAVEDFLSNVRTGKTQLPDFTGVLTVGGAALKLVANNADLVAKALPFLAAAFVVVKTAQAAGNVAALASLPIQAGQVLSNFAAASANRALATAIGSQTAIQNANAVATTRGTVATIADRVASVAGTVARGAATAATAAATVVTTAATAVTNGSALASARATIALVASTAATTAVAAATKAYAAVQLVLNAVLTANPIGLVIAAIALLVAGIVIAYQKSETFRTIVQAALGAVKEAFLSLAVVALGVVDKLLGGYQAIATAAGKLPGPLGAPFRAAADAIGVVRDKVGALKVGIEGIKGKDVKVNAATGEAIQDVQSVGRAVARLRDKTVTITTVNRSVAQLVNGVRSDGGISGRASGGPVRAGTPYIVGEREPELFVPRMSGRILNQNQLAAAGAGGQTVNNYNVTTPAVDSFALVNLLKRMEMLNA